MGIRWYTGGIHTCVYRILSMHIARGIFVCTGVSLCKVTSLNLIHIYYTSKRNACRLSRVIESSLCLDAPQITSAVYSDQYTIIRPGIISCLLGIQLTFHFSQDSFQQTDYTVLRLSQFKKYLHCCPQVFYSELKHDSPLIIVASITN